MRLLRLCAQRRHHENRLLRDKLDEGLVEIEALRHGIEALHDVGIYNYRHPLEDAVAHQQALAQISAEMKSRIAEGTAIEVSTRFTFDNSLAKGRKMTSELAKLMLRAYNVEAENCVRYVKAGNLTGAERRLTNNATVEKTQSILGPQNPAWSSRSATTTACRRHSCWAFRAPKRLTSLSTRCDRPKAANLPVRLREVLPYRSALSKYGWHQR